MKISIILFLLSVTLTQVQAQDKLLTRNGTISFSSRAPLENIEANSQTAVSVIDKKTGQVEFSVLIRSFTFEKALMQEHFNENYLESDKYPKALFKGRIDDLSKINFERDGKYAVNITGQLTIHGETQSVTTTAMLSVQKSNVLANANFSILLSDYKISIPSLVADKVSKKVNISVNLKYEPLSQP